MATRLIVAYLLIALLAAGGVGAAWRMIYNSPRRRLRRHYRARHARIREARTPRE